MWKKLRALINEYEMLLSSDKISGDELDVKKQSLLVHIQFFQHERLIHLIVTVLFAFLTVLTSIALLFIHEIVLAILVVMFIILLVPYIVHYYHLENGVQRLYELYDGLEKSKMS